jgi:hypothetical protein
VSAFVAGSPIAASRRIGFEQTDIYIVRSTGDLCVFSVEGADSWSQPLPISSQQFAPPAAGVTASQQFGTASPQTDIFVVDSTGAINVFWSIGPGTSWKNETISSAKSAQPGSSVAAAPQYGLNENDPTQTDVFVIDPAGALVVYFVDEGGKWSSAIKVSSDNFALPGSPVAAGCRPVNGQIGLETDVFVVDINGALNVFSVSGTAQWQQQKISSDDVFVQGTNVAVARRFSYQLDAFAVDNLGVLNCFSASGDGVWASKPVSGPGVAQPGAPVAASRQFDQNVEQTDVFLVDASGDLNLFYFREGGNWTQAKIGHPGTAGTAVHLAASRHDVALVDVDGNLIVHYVVGGLWNRLAVPTAAPEPAWGLGSSSNFILTNTCSDIAGIRVEIDVTEDIVLELDTYPNGRGRGGFGIQLNCYSTLGDFEGWQQYVVRMVPPSKPGPDVPGLRWVVDNWESQPQNGNLQSEIFEGGPLCELPDFVVPAGYKIVIELWQLPDGLTIGGAVFYVLDDAFTLVGLAEVGLIGLQLFSAPGKVTASDLAPIVGFEVNIVGWANAENARFLSGAGTITYSAEDGTWLLPSADGLPCLTKANLISTGETSNISYAYMARDPAPSITQPFQAISTSAIAADFVTLNGIDPVKLGFQRRVLSPASSHAEGAS